MKKDTCQTCVYFRQHYGLNEKKIFQLYCGHCTYERAKRKRPDAVACENYSYAPPNEETFVTKEYLSKALLDHILNMDILPEIGRWDKDA